MCLAKAITSGVAPMGALLATASLARTLATKGSAWSTYGWHPRSVHVAIAALEYLRRHESRLLGHVDEMSEHFRARLARMRFQDEVRVCGLAIAIDLGDEDRASRLQEKCRRNGLLLDAQEERLMLMPALTIDRGTADAGLDILERCA